MNYAIDGSGAVVFAANGSRYRRYRCPVCRNRVHLRDGPRRAAHFAHNPGEGDPDCEHYHPGSGTPAQGGPTQPTRTRSGHGLYMVVDPALTGRPRWHLEILVPASPDIRGSVRVADSPHGQVTIQCRELFDGGVRAEVRPQCRDYCLEPEGVPDRSYRERLELTTPGLSAHVGTAFEIGATVSRRMSDGKALSWGRSYAIVWPEQLVLPPPPQAVWDELEPRRGWQGAILELPLTESSENEGWAERFLDRPVRHPAPEIGLVSPAVLSVADDGALRVPATPQAIVSVVGNPQTPFLEARLASGLVHRSPIPSQDLKLFAFADLPLGRTSFSLDDPDSDDLTLDVLAEPRCAAPSAEFHFRGPRLSGESHSLPLFSEELPPRLKRAVAGDVQLTGLTCPPGLACRVRSRPSAASPWNEVVFVEPRDGEAGQEQEMGALISYLRAHLESSDLVMDFGSFGVVRLHGDRPLPSAVTIPPDLQDRILWLLSIPGSDVPAQNCLKRARGHWPREVPTSSALPVLRELFDRKFWPIAILPHLIDIDRELAQVFKKAT